MKKLTLFAAALLCLTLTCQSKPAESGAVPGQWTMDFEAARKVAKEKKLPIFINFTGSDWCVWCKHMEKEIFSKQDWKDYAKDSLLMVWVDFPKNKKLVPQKYQKRNQQLAQFFEVTAYPSYIVLDDDGTTQLGEMEAEQQITVPSFINKLNAVLIERECRLQALIAGMPASEAGALKKACQERKTARAELQKMQTKQTQLATQLSTLESKITDLRTKALVNKLTPLQRTSYNNAQKELTVANNELKKWAASNPPQTPENTKAYTAMTQKIADLQNKITGALYTH